GDAAEGQVRPRRLPARARAVHDQPGARGPGRRGIRVGVGEADAVGQDLVAADDLRRLEATLAGARGLLLARDVDEVGPAIERVGAVSLHADAAHDAAVLVEREPAGIGGEAEGRDGVDVAAAHARELNAEEWPPAREVDAGREVLLHDEAGRARGE